MAPGSETLVNYARIVGAGDGGLQPGEVPLPLLGELLVETKEFANISDDKVRYAVKAIEDIGLLRTRSILPVKNELAAVGLQRITDRLGLVSARPWYFNFCIFALFQ